MRHVYLSSIQSLVLYGSDVWIGELHAYGNVKLLRSFQRFALMFMVRAFRSSSTTSLLLFTNLFPIYLSASELAVNAFSRLAPFIDFSPSAKTQLMRFVGSFDMEVPIDLPSSVSLLNSPP